MIGIAPITKAATSTPLRETLQAKARNPRSASERGPVK
jgi:hypothetical protein